MTIALIILSLVALAALGLAGWLIYKGQNDKSTISDDSAMGKTLDLLLKDTQLLKIDQKLSQESNKGFKEEMRQLSDILAKFKARQ